MALTINTVDARDIKELWVAMPDSLAAYLNKDIRQKMVDLAMMDTSLSTENTLKGLSRIDSIADGYLSVRMSDTHSIEMAIATRPSGDSCIVVLSTYTVDNVCDTEVILYDFGWNALGRCTVSPELCQKDSIDIENGDQTVMATVAAKFTDAYTLELNPCVLPKKASGNFTQKKVKTFSLPFK